ncbi:MAG: oligopeptide ABC transporter permease [Bacillota bacterium]
MEAARKDREQDLIREGLVTDAQTWGKIVWRRFRRNRLALLGATILLIMVLLSIFAPVITKYTVGWGRDEIDIRYILAPPSARHPLGTDNVGRDNLTRLLYGGQVSLAVAVVSVGFNLMIGVTVGSIAGYFGGTIDNVLMRITDIVLSFPFLPLALTIVAIRGPAISNLMIAIVFLSWPVAARIVRGEFLSLKEREYVEASRATGARPGRIIWRHLLPNALAPLIVYATLDVASIILAEAGLSYLGFGVPQPWPTWGNMLNQASNMALVTKMPWIWAPPGLMIMLTVLAVNFVGDGLRDALDPRLKQ